jgi:hypothetical protein
MLSRKGAGSERKFPLTTAEQPSRLGEAVGLGDGAVVELEFLLEFVAVGDCSGEGFSDDNSVFSDSARGEFGERVKMLIVSAKAAKPPPIPSNRRNLLGNLEAEGRLVCDSANPDDEFTGRGEFVSCTDWFDMYPGEIALGVEGTHFAWLPSPDCVSSFA